MGFSWAVIRIAFLFRHNFGNPLCALLTDNVGYVVFAIILCKLLHYSLLRKSSQQFVGQALGLPATDAVALQVRGFNPREQRHWFADHITIWQFPPLCIRE